MSGGTGAGKTTFLNAMSDFIPKEERIITIEDNAELQIQGVETLSDLKRVKRIWKEKEQLRIRDLIKSALRMRPDRIIVGEVRGEETVDMISSAMLNGHSGSMSTGHANNPKDMLHRIETMMMMGIDLPLQAIQRQVASALDIIIHLGRIRDKTRKVLMIEEILGYEDGKIQTKTLYEFKEVGTENEKVKGSIMKVAELENTGKLVADRILKKQNTFFGSKVDSGHPFDHICILRIFSSDIFMIPYGLYMQETDFVICAVKKKEDSEFNSVMRYRQWERH